MAYRIVLTGDTVWGLEPELVRTRIGKLMKLSPRQVERLFGTAPVTIKRTEDLNLAEQYRGALTRLGAVCSVVEHADRNPEPKPSGGEPHTSMAAHSDVRRPRWITGVARPAAAIAARFGARARWALLGAAGAAAVSLLLHAGSSMFDGNPVPADEVVTSPSRGASDTAAVESAAVAQCDALARPPYGPEGGVPLAEIQASEALRVCALAVKDFPASSRLNFQYGRALLKAERFRGALIRFRIAADAGHVHAQLMLGMMWSSGRGVAKSHEQALAWYRKAAAQGNADAQHAIAVAYHFGRGVAVDHGQVAQWSRRAAEQDYTLAQFNLGNMYMAGQGVPRDYGTAREWYEKAAKKGHAASQLALGDIHLQGQGVAVSFDEAENWYRKAAEQGYTPAQRKLEELPHLRRQRRISDYIESLIAQFASGPICENIAQVMRRFANSQTPENIVNIQVDRLLDTAYRAGCIR